MKFLFNYNKLLLYLRFLLILIFFLFFQIEVLIGFSLLYANEGSLKWKGALSNDYEQIISTPALSHDGTIYFCDTDNYLHALSNDGSQKWSFKAGGGIISSPTISSDGTIYFGSNDQSLYAINADGSKKWSYYTSDEITESPAIGKGGVIYFVNDSKYDSLHALNPDGTLKWRLSVGYIASSPTIDKNNIIYVMAGDGNYGCGLYAIDIEGTIIWKYTFISKCWNIASYAVENSSPAIGNDGTIYIGNGNDLYAINPDGTSKWIFKTGEHISSSPVIGSDGTIYVGSEDKYFFAINPNDGLLKWHFQTDDKINSTAVIGVDEIIYIASGNMLYAFNSIGTIRWTYVFGKYITYDDISSPIIDTNGTLYIGVKNNFFAINVSSKGIANSPWPVFCHDLRHTSHANIVSYAPVANTGGSKIVFDKVTLDGTSSYDSDGEIISYQWELRHIDNQEYNKNSSNAQPTFLDIEKGYYHITLTVTDNDGLTDSDKSILAVAGKYTQFNDISKIGLIDAINALKVVSGF